MEPNCSQKHRRTRRMNICPTLKKVMTGALVSGALGLIAVGACAGTAQANSGPYTWCPGQSMDDPSGPNRSGTEYVWDTNVCHTWYRVSYGYGNVMKLSLGHPSLSG